MPNSVAPGSPGLGAGEVEVQLDQLQAYLDQVLVPLQKNASQAAATLGSMPMYRDLYGPIAAARELDARHWDAYEVYAPTVSALGDDLALLIDKLRTVIKNYADEDDNAAQALIRVSGRLLGKDGFQADSVYSAHATEQIRQSAPAAAAPAVSAPAPPAQPAAAAAASVPQPVAPAPSAPAPSAPVPTGEDGFS